MTVNISDVMSELKKGDKRITDYSDTDQGRVKDYVPTLIPALDKNLVSGIPASGRVTEVFGLPSSGKSTLMGLIMRNALKMNIIPIYFDVEETMDSERLEGLGVDPSKVITVTPEINKDNTVTPLYIEEITNYIVNMAAKIHGQSSELTSMFIIDSVGFTQSKLEANTDSESATVGQQAKALAIMARKVQANLSYNNGLLIGLNQGRDDMKAPNPKYAQTKSLGGKGWEHFTSSRLRIQKSSAIKVHNSDKTAVGFDTRVTVVKSKIGDNVTDTVTIKLLGARGFDRETNIFYGGVDEGIIKCSGSYTDVIDDGEQIKKQGWVDFVSYLKSEEGKETANEIWKKVALKVFPDIYPALFNTTATMSVENFPEIAGMRKHYYDIMMDKPEDERPQNFTDYVDAGLPID